ncbi:hypothetical protein EMPS_09420 [Entomortierella parvispora]|uniref:Uncharacterized protein n=1 Tax=Entomortierella parvispora TaxID=205924 RepID=A0A9P3HI52_9FUNG|nr:hypothetical protein EMPS_09420 [Entomortierella parvispora]
MHLSWFERQDVVPDIFYLLISEAVFVRSKDKSLPLREGFQVRTTLPQNIHHLLQVGGLFNGFQVLSQNLSQDQPHNRTLVHFAEHKLDQGQIAGINTSIPRRDNKEDHVGIAVVQPVLEQHEMLIRDAVPACSTVIVNPWDVDQP